MHNVSIKIHPDFQLNGKKLAEYRSAKIYPTILQEALDFIRHWNSGVSSLKLQTSGSTGKPKIIFRDLRVLAASAHMTGTYFNLTPGTDALLCLPIKYIAGKMMVVRSLILGWHLWIVRPSLNPLQQVSDANFDFCAMTPSQVFHSLDYINNIKCLIIGGAPISKMLEQRILESYKGDVYETYGMTETVSHIALRNMKHEAYFHTLPGVHVSLDKRECLVIEASYLGDKVNTRDVAIIHSNVEFQILGRLDNILNSGGIKISLDSVQAELNKVIHEPFILIREKDEIFGEILAIIVESEDDSILNHINESINTSALPKDYLPRRMFKIEKFKYLASTKIDWKASRQHARPFKPL